MGRLMGAGAPGIHHRSSNCQHRASCRRQTLPHYSLNTEAASGSLTWLNAI